MIVNLLWAVVFRKVLKEIFVGELQPDETVDAMREAKLLSTVCVIFIVFYLVRDTLLFIIIPYVGISGLSSCF